MTVGAAGVVTRVCGVALDTEDLVGVLVDGVLDTEDVRGRV